MSPRLFSSLVYKEYKSISSIAPVGAALPG
jgi:hypothetical protein